MNVVELERRIKHLERLYDDLSPHTKIFPKQVQDLNTQITYHKNLYKKQTGTKYEAKK